MALTEKRWKEILGMVNPENSLTESNILEQIKQRLKEQDVDTYTEWKSNRFDINYPFANGTLLHFATANSRLDIVKYLINEKGGNINIQDLNGYTPLHLAAYNGETEVVTILVEKGAHVNVQDNMGITPLHFAAKNGHLEVVKALIEKGAKVNLRCKARYSPLYVASRNGHQDVVDVLIEKGANVNLRDNYGYTILHWAAISGEKDVVNILIEKGADVNFQDEDGKIPLHFAAENGHLEVAKVLLDKGAKVDFRNLYMHISLYNAVRFNVEMAKFLIAHAIKLNSSKLRKPDYLVEHKEMSEYWDKCLGELKKIKEEKISEGITFYDILTGNNNDLASYMQNKQIAEILEGYDYKSEFPIYANDLERQVKMGAQRLDALNTAITTMKDIEHIKCFAVAPNIINKRIAEYLSNEDLKNLRKAAIQAIDREEIPKSLESDVRVEPAAERQRGCIIL